MAKRRVMLTVPGELHSEPIIYNIGQQFNLVITLRQADLTEDRGWVILELEGEDKDIEAGITWAISKGVRVEAVGES
jgi:hypothetical protein